jgi:hypothetical protein
MANYIPPNIDNIAFTFGSGGYTAPAFDEVNINFSLRPKSSSTTNLQASIEVMKLYQDSTYTYVKECKTIIVGYSASGIQTLKLPCLYGGIRDLGAFLTTQPPYADLSADLFAIFAFLDLGTFQRAATAGQSDLIPFIRPTQNTSISFSSFVRQSLRQNIDLSGYMKFVKGSKIPIDLGAYLQDIQPVDIGGYVNIIEIRNLASTIEGVYWKGSAELGASFHRILARSNNIIAASLFGWATFDLSARITSFSTLDLFGTLNAGFFAIHKDLTSLIKCILPVDLGASLHGYAAYNLSAFLIQGYQPNDLQAIIGASTPVDIQAKINAVFGTAIPFDLPGYIHGVYKQDLLAYIGVNAAKNLKAYIDAVGKYLDLEARIVPRTINIKRMILVPLFEHKDLRATIQYSCKSSSYRDLYSSIYAMRKLDLKAYIIGWHSGQADNVKDLAAYINFGSYFVQNSISIQGEVGHKISNTHSISGDVKDPYKTFNFYSVTEGFSTHFLAAYITGVRNSSNLKSYITAKPIANFTTIPEWIDPKTNIVTLNIKRFEERWTRFVELMFFTNSQEDYHYFYVSGENKVYKVDKNRTWRIEVTGYQEDTDTIYTRNKVNVKYVFNMKNYATVDAAIRDLIDRVTLYRSLDLGATIIPYDLDYRNLAAYVLVKGKKTWSRSLLGAIKCLAQAEDSLSGSIQPLMYKDTNNLTANIVGRSYEPPAPENVKLIFEDPGYVAPAPYSNLDWTYRQAEKFWIYDEE